MQAVTLEDILLGESKWGECVEDKKHLNVPGGSTPSQYSFPKGLTEIQDLIEFREMNFALGNIFKACFRIGHCDHSDAKRELNKIIWFANRELKRIDI